MMMPILGVLLLLGAECCCRLSRASSAAAEKRAARAGEERRAAAAPPCRAAAHCLLPAAAQRLFFATPPSGCASSTRQREAGTHGTQKARGTLPGYRVRLNKRTAVRGRTARVTPSTKAAAGAKRPGAEETAFTVRTRARSAFLGGS